MKDGMLKREWLTIWDAIQRARQTHHIRKQYEVSIMTTEETIAYIKNNRCSIARYGDGEMQLMLQQGEPGFQNGSDELAAALTGVFSNSSPELLICLPRPLISGKGLKKSAKQFWQAWAITHQEKAIKTIRDVTNGATYRFGDAYLSRPYSAYKSSKNAQKVFPLLKSLWADRDLLIVEGAETRLGIGNDLFANAKSIKRILAPAVNAFNCYSKILKAVISYRKEELVILALGPTATVLASDLSKEGIQALDLGHVDIQYEWYLRGESFVSIPGKHTNEVVVGQTVAACEDEDYFAQIIASVE